MKILQVWKQLELMPGIHCTIFKRKFRESEAFFDKIVEAVKKSDLDYALIDQREEVSDYRGEWKK